MWRMDVKDVKEDRRPDDKIVEGYRIKIEDKR